MFHTVSASNATKLRRTRGRGYRTALHRMRRTRPRRRGGRRRRRRQRRREVRAKPLIVWIDTSRIPYEQAYMKANPGANIKWVIYNGNENGTGVLQSKFALWNRIGWPSDAPDVMFDTQNYDAVQLGTAPYNDLLNLEKYVPASVLKGYAGHSLSACTTPSGQIICLRNDTPRTCSGSTRVCTRSSSAKRQFRRPGQGSSQTDKCSRRATPATWSGTSATSSMTTSSIGATGVRSTRSSAERRSRSTRPTSPAPRSNSLLDASGRGQRHHHHLRLCSRGLPRRQGRHDGRAALVRNRRVRERQQGAARRAGRHDGGLSAAAVILGQPITGALGGGLWLVSSHSRPTAAAAFAQYMSTSPNIQKVRVDAGLPDYAPDQDAYSRRSAPSSPTRSPLGKHGRRPQPRSGTVGARLRGAPTQPGRSTVVPGVTATPPSTLGKQMNSFALALANDARLAGWTVQSTSKCINSFGGSGC